MTFGAKVDTATGHFEIFDDYEEGDESYTPSKPVNEFSNVNIQERETLKKAFFELQS